jgi:hypothetical protein
VWAFPQFGCNIGALGRVIMLPTKNGSQISEHFNILGAILVIQVATKLGHTYWALELDDTADHSGYKLLAYVLAIL